MTHREKLAYLAGLIDGEGTIDLRFEGVNKTALAVRLHVYNTDETMIDWILKTFGGNKRTIARHNEKWRTCYIWEVNCGNAVEVFCAVQEFLITKKAKCALAVEAWENRQPMPRGRRRWDAVPPEVIKMREGYILAFKSL